MGVTILFTPLYGARSTSHAHAYLLQIDSFNFLLDCGWDPVSAPFSAISAPLKRVLPTIDAVLISHSNLHHLGALPSAFATLGLPPRTPVFSTLPVWRMGQMFLYDAHQSFSAAVPFPHFDLDAVDAAFESRGPTPNFHLLKYQQACPLSHLPQFSSNRAADNLVITPHPAGHSLGGAVWNIAKGSENVVYALDLNHRREAHLNPTTLSSFPRPSVLIFGAANAPTKTQTLSLSHLLTPITNTVAAGGSVLIPVDTAARVIELAVELNEAWLTHRVAHRPDGARDAQPVPLVVLHEFATQTFAFARTMIEFMSDRVVKRFDTTRENLFDFKHLRCCTSKAEVDALTGPKVVLASAPSLEVGFARDLFVEWAPGARNTVIFVDRPEPGTLAAELQEHMRAGEKAFQIDLVVRRYQEFEGDALAKWKEEKAEAVRLVAESAREEARIAAEAEADEERVRTQAALATMKAYEGEKEATAVAMAAAEKAKEDQAVAVADGVPTAPATSAVLAVAGQEAKNSATLPTGGDNSSSEEDSDDEEYDNAMVMGMSGRGRPAAASSQLLKKNAPSGLLKLSAPARASAPIGGVSSVVAAASPPPDDYGSKIGLGSMAPALGMAAVGNAIAQTAPGPGAGKKKEGIWDDYGATIGINRFAIGEDPDAEMTNEEQSGVSRLRLPIGVQGSADGSANVGGGESEPVPKEYTSRDLTLDVACQLVAVNRSGLSEGDALKHLVKELEPRRVILVHGNDIETDHLEHHLASALSSSAMAVKGGLSSSTNRLRSKYLALAEDGKEKKKKDGVAGGEIDGGAPPAKKLKQQVNSPSASVVAAPTEGETVDVTSDTNVHKLTLDSTVVEKLIWNDVRGSSISFLAGSVMVPEEATAEGSSDAVLVETELTKMCSDPATDTSNAESTADGGGGSVELPASAAMPPTTNNDAAGGEGVDAMDLPLISTEDGHEFMVAPTPQPIVFVGTIMLSKLKETMKRAGIQADLIEGILCVENSETGAVVLVKKVGTQNLVIEGALCEEYFAVRDVLYNELVILSPGSKST